jgi:maleate isomerase
MALRKRIGVMVPSTNTTFEADFQLVAPRDVTIHGQRLWLTNGDEGAAGMDRMNAEIESGAKYLATANVNVVAYGCTTGSFYRGPGYDRDMLQTISKAAGVPAVAAAPAVVDALRHFGARRVSVATPYPDWNNQRLRAYLEASGFEVLNVEGEPKAAASGNQGINDHDPEEVVKSPCKSASFQAGGKLLPWSAATECHGRQFSERLQRGVQHIQSRLAADDQLRLNGRGGFLGLDTPAE